MALDESKVQDKITELLSEIDGGKFGCRERKSTGRSTIKKPVDLEVYFKDNSHRVAIAVEVADVNTTQLVGEVSRLYFDSCPLKLLILGHHNTQRNSKEQCENQFNKFYAQDDIQDTPVRVVWWDDNDQIRVSLKELLLL